MKYAPVRGAYDGFALNNPSGNKVLKASLFLKA